MAAVPQELIEDIFSRMPVKSLLRFKTASKNWYSLISEDHKFHLKQSSSYASKNLILHRINNVFRYSNIDTYESRKIICPVERAVPCKLIGSANGLICLASFFKGCRGRCFIWNPCTGEYKIILLPFLLVGTKIGFTSSGYTRLFGFGYNSIYDDYKIIGDFDSRIRIFSLKTNSWKMLDFWVQCPMVESASYSHGALHWCDRATEHIVAFDLAKEKIFLIEFPYNRNTWCTFFDYQGSFCMSDGKCIWVMSEYGNAKSWAKFCTSLPEECSVPMGISRLGEVVYPARGELGFLKSDIQGRIADEDKSEMYNSLNALFVYNESLISPKYFDPK